MPKKIVKKKKIRVFNLLIVLLILGTIIFGVYYFFNKEVQGVVIQGTSYLSDDYILELGGIKEYPSFLFTNTKAIEKKIESSKYIEKVTIHRKSGFLYLIKVVENQPVFFDTNQGKYVFSNGKVVGDEEISHLFRVPRLLNYIPDTKYKKFLVGMGNIKSNTIVKISDIEYKPNEYDKDRFLLYMDDGNMVYLTLTKFKMINHYNEVLKQLENHKGVLYLDNGNHFKIME